MSPTIRNAKRPSPRLKPSPATVVQAIKFQAHGYLVQQIEALEQAARQAGLYITARALNNAKNASGWEVAGELERAGAVARGDRPTESRGLGR